MRLNPTDIAVRAVLALLFIQCGAEAIAADDAELALVRQKMSSMFAEIAPQDVNRSPIAGWYEVQKGSIVAYVSKDGRYLLQGDLIDLDLQTNLSEKARTDARRDLMSKVGDDQIIAFTPAKVQHSVTVFTDVECTYCRRLHNQIDEYMAAGIEIRYVLYPRNGPASRSWNTSEDVSCASDKGGALTAAKQDRGFESQKCVTRITDNYALGRDVGLTGTPAIVFEDGTLHSGYLPPDALTARLREMSAN